MKIFAKYLDENGYSYQPEEAREKGLIKGELYELVNASIGQSSSSIYVLGAEGSFNSVMFDFYDGTGKEIDLMETEYNTYRRIRRN